MLANFFGKSKPINFIVIVALFFCNYSIATFVGFSLQDFTREFIVLNLGLICSFLLIFFFYNFIIFKNSLTFDNSYSFFLFVIFISFFVKDFMGVKVLIMFLLNLLFLRKIYSLKSIKAVFQKLYDAGFWLGVLFIIEPFSVVYFVLLYIAIYLHQKIVYRTLLIPIIGFITPLIIYFTFCFWNDKSELFLELFHLFPNYDLAIYSQNHFFTPLLLIGFCTITSIILKTPRALSVNNTFKINWILVVFNLLVSMFFVLLLSDKNGSEILFLLLPISVIVANGIEIIEKKVIKEIVVLILLLSSLLFQFIV